MPRPRARSDGGRLQEFQQSASQCGRRIETPRGSSNSSVFGGSFTRTFLTKLCNKMVALRSTISRHVLSGLVGIFMSTKIERKEIIKNRKYICISLTCNRDAGAVKWSASTHGVLFQYPRTTTLTVG